VEFKDYYATLGVGKTATDKELKQAYRKLARKFHPDVNPGDKAAESRFKEINEAYEVLGDSDKRKKYDELGSNWRMYEQAGAGAGAPAGGGFGGFGGFGGDPGQAWGTPGGGSSYRTVTPEEMEDLLGGAGGQENPFSDFFKTFFGGGGGAERDAGGRKTGRRSARARAGSDVEQPIDLTLEDAFQGVTRRLSIKHRGHTRTIDVRIPAGVKDNARVRVPGEGEPGSGGAAAGDLYLRIRLLPHAQFERKGNDLYAKTTVPATAAVLGGEAEAPSLAGRPIRLKIPPTTQNGQVLRLKGQGMPSTSAAGERGDLYVTVDVQLPKALTPEQREHWEALAQLDGKPPAQS
jgi:DnaJ-class molecular chaperone